MKSHLANFLDKLFLTIVSWLLSAIIISYFVKETYLVVLIASVVTLAIGFLANLRQKKTREKEKEDYHANLCAGHFIFHDDAYALDYFHNALRNRYEVTKNKFYLTVNKTMIIPCVTEALSLKKAVYFYSEALRKNAETLVVLTFKSEKFPVDLKEKLTGLRLEIFGADKTYRLLKSLNSLPATEKPLKTQKLKNFLIAALGRKRAKGYLTAAVFLLFGAYFSFFSFYYIAASAVCLTLTLLCKLDITERLKNNNNSDKTEKPSSPPV